jgi:hypothetical protein
MDNRYFDISSNAYVKTNLIAWLKKASSGNPNYKEGKTYLVLITST